MRSTRLRHRLILSTALHGGLLLVATPGRAQTPLVVPVPLPAPSLPAASDATNTVGISAVTAAGTSLTVGVNADKAMIDWKRFDIPVGNTVQFKDETTTSPTSIAVLNRIVGDGGTITPSRIDGMLTAPSNMAIFLINAAGITFGPTGAVNVGSLIASTLDLPRAKFTSGNNNFTADPTITGADAGTVRVNAGARFLATGSAAAGLGNLVLLGAKVAVETTTGTGNPARFLTRKGADLNPDADAATITSTTIAPGAEDGDVALVAADDVTVTTSTGSPLSIIIAKGTAVSGAFKVDGSIAGRNVTMALATRGGVTDTLLSVAGMTTATGATVTDRGVVLTAGRDVAGAMMLSPALPLAMPADIDPAGGVATGATIDSARGLTIAASGAATAGGDITAGGDMVVNAASITLGTASTTVSQAAAGKVDLTARTGNIGSLGTLTLRSNSGNVAYDATTPVDRGLYLDAAGGTIDLTGSSLVTGTAPAGGYAMQIRNDADNPLSIRGVTLGNVTAHGITVADASHTLSRSTAIDVTGNLTLGTATLTAATVTATGDIVATALDTGGTAALTSSAGKVELGGLKTTAGNATLIANTTATVSGTVDVAGDYAVTGTSVTLGATGATPTTQSATGAVTITATGGTLTGRSGLTLRSGLTRALTLATTGLTDGNIAFAGTTLATGGTTDRAAVRIRSRDAANTVTLGTVDAGSLLGAIAGAPFTMGIARTAAITVGNVTLANAPTGADTALKLDAGSAALVTGTLSAPTVTLGAGAMTLAGITGTGTVTLTGSGALSVGTIAGITGLTIGRGGSVTLADVTASGDILIGETSAARPTTITTTGALTTTGTGNARLTGSGVVTIEGAASIAGTYAVTGASVTLGKAGVTTEQAAGSAVTIEATGGNVTGLSALTLRSDGNGLGNAPLTIATSAAGGGTIDFTGARLRAGTTIRSAVRIAPGSSANVVTLGDVTASALQGDIVGAAYVDGITRATTLRFGTLDLTNALLATSTTGDIRLAGATIGAGPGITLSAANGTLFLPATLSAPGAIALTTGAGLTTGSVTSTGGTLTVTTGGNALTAASLTGAAGLTIAAGAGAVTLGSGSAGAGALRITAGTLNDGAGRTGLTADGAMTVALSGAARLGTLTAASIDVSAGAIDLTGATAPGDIVLNTGGTLDVGTVTAGASGGTGLARLISGGALTGTGASGVGGVTAQGSSADMGDLTARDGAVSLIATGGNARLGSASAGTSVTVAATGGSASVTGAVGATGDYTVSGTGVSLGSGAAPILQSAGGAVSVTASNGTLAAGSGLTLRANADASGAEALTLATTGTTGGDIAFAGNLQAGLTTAAASALTIRSRSITNAVTLGDIIAQRLTGATGGAPDETGLTRTAAIRTGAVTLDQSLVLNGGSTVDTGAVTASVIELAAQGTLTAASLTATGGAIMLSGSGDTTVTGDIRTTGANAGISINRSGAGRFGSLFATQDVQIGSATTIDVTGTTGANRDITIIGTGKQTYTGTVTASAIDLTAQGTLTAASLTATGGAIMLSGSGDTTVTGNVRATGTNADIRINRSGEVGLGNLFATQDVQIGSATKVNVTGTTSADRDITITGTGTHTYTGAVTARRDATLTGGTLSLDGGVTATTGALMLTANTGDLTLATVNAGTDATLFASGIAQVTGAVALPGNYSVTGGSVSLGTAGTPTTQAAGGTVTITATGGTLIGLAGLTLRSGPTGALTLATTGTTGGDITFAGTTLATGGTTDRPAVQIRSREAANPVTLGTVNAGSLLGAVAGAPFTTGITRTAAITVGNVTLANAPALVDATLRLNAGTATLTTGILTAPTISLSAGDMTLGAIAGTGAATLTGSGTLNAGTIAGITGLTIERGGSVTLADVTAGNILIGQNPALRPTTVTTTGALATTGAIRIASSGDQNHAGPVTAGTDAAFASDGSLTLGTLTATGTATLTAAGLTATSLTAGDLTATSTGTGAITIGALTTDVGDATVSGAAAVSIGGIASIAGDYRVGGATMTLGGIGRAGAVTLTGSGTLGAGTIAGIGSLTIDRGGSVTLAAVTASGDILIGQTPAARPTAITTTGALTSTAGAIRVTGTGMQTLGGPVGAHGAAILTGGSIVAGTITSTTATVGLTAADTVTLASATSAGDTVIDAGGIVRVTGPVDSGADYRVSGSVVVLGDGAAPVTQTAGGSVRLVSGTGTIAGGAGLTLQADRAATGLGTLVLDGAGGIALDPATVLRGGSGTTGDIGVRTGTGAGLALGIVEARRLTGADTAGALTATLAASGTLDLAGTVTTTRTLAASAAGTLTTRTVAVTGTGQDLLLTTAGTTADITARGPLTATRDIGLTAARNLAFTDATAGAAATATATTGTLAGTTLTGGTTADAVAGDTLSLTTLSGQTGALARGTVVTLGAAETAGGLLSLTATTGDLTTPRAVSGGGVTLSAGGDIALGLGQAGGDLTVADALDVGGIGAGTRTTLTAGRDLTVTARRALRGATFAAGRDLALTAGSIDLLTGTAATGAARLTTTIGAATIRTLTSGSAMIATAGNAVLDRIDTTGALTIAAQGTLGATALTAGGALDARGTTATIGRTTGATTVALTATTGDLTLTGVTGATGVTLLAARDTRAGTVTASGANADLSITTRNLDGGAGVRSILTAGRDLTLTASGTALAGPVGVGRQATLTAASLDLSTLTAGTASITATTGDAVAGSLTTTGSVDYTASGLASIGTTNAGGLATIIGGTIDLSILTANAASITATAGDAVAGSLTTTGVLDYSASGAARIGTIDAGGLATITGGTVDLGTVRGRDSLRATTRSGALTIIDLSTNEDVVLTAASDAKLGRIASTGGSLAITAGGTLGATTLAAGTTITATGTSATIGTAMATDVALTARNGALSIGTVTAGNGATLLQRGTGGLAVTGRVATGGDAVLTGDGALTAPTITAGRDLILTTGTTLAAPVLTAGRDLRASVGDAARLTTLTAGRAIDVTAGGTATVSGTVTAASYAVQGSTVTLGDTAGPVTQQASGAVAIRATQGGITGVRGLTLIADNDGDGTGDLTLRATTGIGFVTGTGLLAGRNGSTAIRLAPGTGAALTLDVVRARTLLSDEAGAARFAHDGAVTIADLLVRDATTIALSGGGATTPLALGTVDARNALTLTTTDALSADTLTVAGALAARGGSITITGTDAGSADIASTAGMLDLARLTARGAATLDATGSIGFGTVTAGGSLSLGASGDIIGRGMATLASTAGAVTVATREAADAGGAIRFAAITAATDLAVTGRQIALTTATATGGSATLTARGNPGASATALTVGRVDAGGAALLSATRGDGASASAGNGTIRLGSAEARGGTLRVTADGDLTGLTATTGTALTATGTVTATIGRAASIDTAGAGGDLTIDAGELRLATGIAAGSARATAGATATIGSITAGTIALATRTGPLDVTTARATDALTLTAGADLTLADGIAGGAAMLTTTGSARVADLKARDATITGDTLSLDRITTTAALTATAGRGGATLGTIATGANATFTVDGALTIGAATSDGSIVATAGDPLRADRLASRLATDLTAQTTTIGTVTTGTTLTVANGTGALAIDRGTIGTTARITTTGDARINALTADRNVTFTGQRDATFGTIASTNDAATLTTTGTLTATGLSAGRALTVTAGGATIGTATAGGDVTAAATAGDLSLTMLTAGSATITASGTASIGGAVGVTGDLGVRAGTIALGTAGTTVRQRAGGIALTATGGAIAGRGALTLSAGTGGLALTAASASGAIDLAATTALDSGGSLALTTAGTATLGSISNTGRAITVSASDIALAGLVTADTITLTNRSPANPTRLGDVPADNATEFGTGSGPRFDLTTAEIGRLAGGQVILDAQTGAVTIGDVALGTGTGSTLFQIRTSGRMDVLGRFVATGSPIARTIVLGGGAETGTRAGMLRVAATSAGGGRLLVGGGTLDLRADAIGVGMDTGFLDAIGVKGGPASLDVATRYVAQSSSALYNATLGNPLGLYGDPVTVQAGRMIVRYGGFALFQNTGHSGTTGGVVLGRDGQAQTLELRAALPANAVALFGSINGITGTATSLLGDSTLVVGDGVSRADSRANGCLIGSVGGGCLSASLAQPALNIFDSSRLDVFRTSDDLTLPFDPLVSTSNEALFSDIADLGADIGLLTTDAPCPPDDKTCTTKGQR